MDSPLPLKELSTGAFDRVFTVSSTVTYCPTSGSWRYSAGVWQSFASSASATSTSTRAGRSARRHGLTSGADDAGSQSPNVLSATDEPMASTWLPSARARSTSLQRSIETTTARIRLRWVSTSLSTSPASSSVISEPRSRIASRTVRSSSLRIRMEDGSGDTMRRKVDAAKDGTNRVVDRSTTFRPTLLSPCPRRWHSHHTSPTPSGSSRSHI